MDLESLTRLLGLGDDTDETLDLQNMMQLYKVKRSEDENLSVVLPSLLESELDTANVVLLLDNQTPVKAHKCFLSASPVLKQILTSLDARLDKTVHISVPGYSRECVVSLLHFLYKGFVVLKSAPLQQEFLGFCRTLKLNPPVVKEDGITKEKLTKDKAAVDKNLEYSDLSDDDLLPSSTPVSPNDEITEKSSGGEEVSPGNANVDTDTNSNLLSKESEIHTEKDSVDKDDAVPADKIIDNEFTPDTNTDKLIGEVNNNPESSNITNTESLETIPNSVPESELGPICDISPTPIYDTLVNLKSPTEQEYEDETTDSISNFLNLLNAKEQDENKGQQEVIVKQEEDTSEIEEEMGPFGSFKMPESFDIPQDYIKEIIPHRPSDMKVVTSDDEVEKKFTIPANQVQLGSPSISENKVNMVKVEKKVIESLDKKGVKNLNFDDDIFKEEFIDNTPVQDEIEQITYKKDETSKRYRDPNKPKVKKPHNPKKDRRKMISSLFSESEEDLPSTSSMKLSFKDSDNVREVTPSSDGSRTPTPTTNLRNELEEKKERMKKKLKYSVGDEIEDPKLVEYRKKKKQMQESSRKGSGSTPTKVHTCHSSCMCVKKRRNEEDNKWLVDDDYESSDDKPARSTDSEASTDSNSMKTEKVSSQKKKLKKRIVPAENSSDETDDGEDPEVRRKRLDDRKKRKGGDVLAWMNKKASVSVSVQTKPKAVILDMALYKMKLLAEDASEESEQDIKEEEPLRKPSESDSDDEIPKGKRFSPVKVPDSEEDLRPRKKLKKHKKKRKRVRLASPDKSFPVEEVVWTPAMYQKWDKTRHKKGNVYDSDSDAPKSKHKKLKRSLSNEPKQSSSNLKHHKNLTGISKIQRSVSSLESIGIPHNYGSSSNLGSKPASSLPKIPKLKKPEPGKS